MTLVPSGKEGSTFRELKVNLRRTERERSVSLLQIFLILFG